MTATSKPFSAEEIIEAVSIKFAEERTHRLALEARLTELNDKLEIATAARIDPEINMLPPALAAEVAHAVRTLHEAPLVVERSEPASAPKVVRIERDADGNLVPIYDEPQP